MCYGPKLASLFVWTHICFSLNAQHTRNEKKKNNKMYVVTATKLSLLLIRLLISLLIKWLNNWLPGCLTETWTQPKEENREKKKKTSTNFLPCNYWLPNIRYFRSTIYNNGWVLTFFFFLCLSFNEFDEKSIHWRRCGSRNESQPSLCC